MAIYRIFSDADGESHIEDPELEDHPGAGGADQCVRGGGCRSLTGRDTGTLIPALERRLIVHLSGEVEIGASDGAKRVLRAGDIG